MINLLSIPQTRLVTGAKKDNASTAMIQPNFQVEPQPIFKDLPNFQVMPSQPTFEPTFHSASKNHIHAGIDYNATPNLSIGVNARVTKSGEVSYIGFNGHAEF